MTYTNGDKTAIVVNRGTHFTVELFTNGTIQGFERTLSETEAKLIAEQFVGQKSILLNE
jgi:hypothetical protein